MPEKNYLSVDEVAHAMGISKSYAYKIVRKLNAELDKLGFLTVSGRVNRQYFLERTCYGTKHYYEMSGQMKTMLDRSNPLYGSDYQFRDIYLLTAAAEDESSTPEGAIHGLQGWIACFEKARLAGTVFAGGVNAPGEIQNHPARKEAFDLGAAIQ